MIEQTNPLLLLVLLVAVLAITATKATKALITWRYEEEPSWHDVALQGVSTLGGGAFALVGLGTIDLPWFLLVAIGLGVGANATVVVAAVKGIVLRR